MLSTREPGPIRRGPTAAVAPAAAKLTPQQRRLLEYLVAARAPQTVAELSRALDVHPNTIREHLAALLERQLVDAESAPSAGRGRPKKLYAATARAGSSASSMAGLLTAALTSLPPAQAARVAYDWGAAWAEDLAAAGQFAAGLDARTALVELMAAMGFEPEVPDRDTIALTHCPLLLPGRDVPPGLCAIHQGVVDTLLPRCSGDVAAARVEPFATPAACRVRLMGQ